MCYRVRSHSISLVVIFVVVAAAYPLLKEEVKLPLNADKIFYPHRVTIIRIRGHEQILG